MSSKLGQRLLLAALAALAGPPSLCAAAPGIAADVGDAGGLSAEQVELRGAAGECLAGEAGEACSEDRMEGDEQALLSGARTELLQRGMQLRTHKASSRGTGQTLAATDDDSLFGKEPYSAEAEDQAGDEMVALSVSKTQEQSSGGSSPVDCQAHPMFCNAKLNCAGEPVTDSEKADLATRLASRDGHVNLRSWCAGYPLYALSVQKCIVEEDLDGYAQSMYESQKKLNLLDADAVYCFAVGHCNNTAVTSKTTLLEAEASCNEQFGHERWTGVGWNQMDKVMKVAFAFESGELKVNVSSWADKLAVIKNLTAVSAMTACAMGNFHCDIAYCKRNFCNDAQYRSKFGNLSWAV